MILRHRLHCTIVRACAGSEARGDAEWEDGHCATEKVRVYTCSCSCLCCRNLQPGSAVWMVWAWEGWVTARVSLSLVACMACMHCTGHTDSMPCPLSCVWYCLCESPTQLRFFSPVGLSVWCWSIGFCLSLVNRVHYSLFQLVTP